MPFSLRARIPESNMNFTNSDPSIQRIGYCLQDEPTLRKIYQQKGADGLTNLEGEYTLIRH
jgi:mannose/fructose/N-acetylgalactosamine-specific phosphotransferase system component IID